MIYAIVHDPVFPFFVGSAANLVWLVYCYAALTKLQKDLRRITSPTQEVQDK